MVLVVIGLIMFIGVIVVIGAKYLGAKGAIGLIAPIGAIYPYMWILFGFFDINYLGIWVYVDFTWFYLYGIEKWIFGFGFDIFYLALFVGKMDIADFILPESRIMVILR